MTLYSATITLLLVMDPLGNIPLFLSILKPVSPQRRKFIILREALIAFCVLALFLFCGPSILESFSISQPAVSLAGGIILFLIALKMIFPPPVDQYATGHVGEPFIVPLAIPLIAGPSALATVLLFAADEPTHKGLWLIALATASVIVTIVLLFSDVLRRVLGERGLTAMERLMGMLLTIVSVQMFLSGIAEYFKLSGH
ncbi:MarC family protein [soil metagenome]